MPSDASAMHTTLDPLRTSNHDSDHNNIHINQPHHDPITLWTHTNTEARATNVDALEAAMRSFTLTPDKYKQPPSASSIPIYDVNNLSIPTSSSSYKRYKTNTNMKRLPSHNGIRIQSNIAKAYRYRDDKFATDMHIWRNKVSIKDIRDKCTNITPGYSVGVWSAGVGVCTIGSVRAGFTPIWSTETDKNKAQAWETLFSAPCLGDTFAVDWSKQRTPIYICSGTNCEAYSHSGPRAKGLPAGRYHPTGKQFVEQVVPLLIIQPHVIKLEMSDGANDTNDGEEVDMVCSALSTKYYVHLCRRMETWRHGDGTNRKRMFIIAFHRDKCGATAQRYEFPEPICTDSYYPIAADYAIPDEHVPPDYWIKEPIGEVQWLQWQDPMVGKLHKIAYVVDQDMGPPQRPHAIYSWLSLFNTQVTTNGGGRRPPLTCTYDPSVPMEWTRMTCPLESVRLQGLPDDFLEWYYSLPLEHTEHERDNNLRSSVNSGIPLRTSTAIDASVHAMLIRCNIPFDINESAMPRQHAHVARDKMRAMDNYINKQLPAWLGPENRIRRITLDTGATNTFLYTDIETALTNPTKSHATIGTAGKGAAPLSTSMQGELRTLVFNMCRYDNIPSVTPFILPKVTTVPELSKELLSPDEFYRYGKFNILLRQPDYESGVSELYREARPGLPEARIPLIYDWLGSGGWHMYYMPSRDMDKHDERILAKHMDNVLNNQDKGSVERWGKTLMNDRQARKIHALLADHVCIKDMRISRFLRGEDMDNAEGSRGPSDSNPDTDPLEPFPAHIPPGDIVSGTDNPNPTLVSGGGSDNPKPTLVPGSGSNNTDTPNPTLALPIGNTMTGPGVPSQVRPLPQKGIEERGDIKVMGQQVSQDQRASTVNPIPNPKVQISQHMTHHPCMSEIRGATAGITRKGINRMSYIDKHKLYSHMGSCKGCAICVLAGGAMRKIYKKVDPYKEIRPGYMITMDIVTFDVESVEGNIYAIILWDVASEVLWALPIHKRSAVYDAIEEWVKDLRNDPIYDDLPYPIVTIISTDNAGEWGYENKRWQEMATRARVKMRYGCPDRKEEVARGERAVGLFEVLLKASLMERNLPPSWWQRVSLDVCFTWNRFAKISYHPAIPIDGDRPRPIEVLTRGFISRRLCDKQLAEFVPCGTPALVHDPDVKGSALKPKTRWAVAIGMYGDQPIWLDPLLQSKFRSKSYVAYMMQSGYNYTHFLTLPPLPSTRRRCTTELETPDGLVLMLPDTILPGETREVPKIDITPDPTLTDTHSDKHLRSTIGPTLIDREGKQYKADKTTGVITLQTQPVNPPTPKPTVIIGEAEKRPVSERVKSEVTEEQFRDLCEIVPEYQDIAYQNMYDISRTLECPLIEVSFVFILRIHGK